MAGWQRRANVLTADADPFLGCASCSSSSLFDVAGCVLRNLKGHFRESSGQDRHTLWTGDRHNWHPLRPSSFSGIKSSEKQASHRTPMPKPRLLLTRYGNTLLGCNGPVRPAQRYKQAAEASTAFVGILSGAPNKARGFCAGALLLALQREAGRASRCFRLGSKHRGEVEHEVASSSRWSVAFRSLCCERRMVRLAFVKPDTTVRTAGGSATRRTVIIVC